RADQDAGRPGRLSARCRGPPGSVMLSLVEPPLEARAAARLTGFAGFLRANGFSTGGGDAVQVLRTAERVGVLDPHILRWSLQALLCGRCEEWRRFDELFDA